MQRKATIEKAQRLLEEFGPGAYEHAQALARAASRKHDKRLAKFLGKVARRLQLHADHGQQRPRVEG